MSLVEEAVRAGARQEAAAGIEFVYHLTPVTLLSSFSGTLIVGIINTTFMQNGLHQEDEGNVQNAVCCIWDTRVTLSAYSVTIKTAKQRYPLLRN